jgi:hypothetical protein
VPTSLVSWRDAVIAAQAQSDVALRGVNQLARESELSRAAELPNLKESDFEPALDAKSLAIWHGTFDDLAAYGQALAQLADPATVAEFGPSLTKLSQAAAAQAKSPAFQERPGLASAIGKFGTAIAGATARAKAQEVMRDTDSEVSEVLGEMSAMIGDQQSGVEIGVLATVRSLWTDRANQRRADFLKATNADAKRRIAADYAETLEKRATADQVLREVKRSIESLAAAHTAGAQGNSSDLSALIAGMREQTRVAQSIVDDLRRRP